MKVYLQSRADFAQNACVKNKESRNTKVSRVPQTAISENAAFIKNIYGRAFVGLCTFCANKDNTSQKPASKTQTDDISAKLKAAKLPPERIEELCSVLKTEDDCSFLNSILEKSAKKDGEENTESGILNLLRKFNFEFAKRMYNDEDFPKNEIERILYYTTKANITFAEMLCFDRELNFRKNVIQYKIRSVNEDNLAFAERLYANKDASDDPFILDYADRENLRLAEVLCFDRELDFDKRKISGILDAAEEGNIDESLDIIGQYKEGKILSTALAPLLNQYISLEDIKKLESILGKEAVSSLNENDLTILCKLSGFYQKQDIDEIPREERKNILHALVLCNDGIFRITSELRKDFPLIPNTEEEYSALLNKLAQSIEIKVEKLNNEQNDDFNSALNNLADLLSLLSDEEFNSLSIAQEYTKDEFIEDVLNITNGLTLNKRQKVCGYFGFELQQNRNTKTGYSISGYPGVPGNKNGFEEDEDIKKIIKQLEGKVAEFSERNSIICKGKINSNSARNIENALNIIIQYFPELITLIGKEQHKPHDFDAFKHNLKVIQKVARDRAFNKLSDSDKKVMLIAGLLHNIGKNEGETDKNHALRSSFDAFYITNKLNLKDEERKKLYSLIKYHNWPMYINDADNNPKDTEAQNKELLKRQLSTAFDMQYDNLFDMSVIFAGANLKAVKSNDEFFTEHKNAADAYSVQIENYISKLKATRPLMPITPIPKASTINNAITFVGDDYSTNIKGVYKDEDGLIIIKFNELSDEDLEKIGFKKGASTRGIKLSGKEGEDGNNETGNIKFYVHGLDNLMQLSKFRAFELPNSDALLCVSYSTKPETMYRFFRTQGIILNTDADYSYSMTGSDSVSGHNKNIDNFKNDCLFGKKREEDRLFVSKLIKQTLNLSDEEYAKFVEQNINKQMHEIEPKEAREKLIQAFADIKSDNRTGNRSYNEAKISNPKIMAVYSYPANDEVGCVKDFMEKTKNKTFDPKSGMTQNPNVFLREYALENDIPFIIFGD